MCYALDRDNRQKNGQIAHINRKSSISTIENLAYLCLDHHNAYDSRMKQTKNYTPNELSSYKAELEAYISQEWDKPIINNDIQVDVFSGKYSHSRENASADIEVKYIGGNVLQIQGMAFWGTNNEGGPNMGILDCVAEISGTKAIFRDKFHDEEYVLEISFLGNKISVTDNYLMGYYGNGVCFSGEYYKEENVAPDKSGNLRVMNVAVYGCFTVRNDKKIILDSTSEEINSVIKASIDSTTSRIFPYKNAILLHFAQVDTATLATISYEELNQTIKLKIQDVGHVASIHFFKNESVNNLHAIMNYDEFSLNYSSPSETLQKLANLILSSSSLSRNELIRLCLNLFYLVYGQIHLDMMLDEKDYKNLHYTLDGCQKLALEIKSSTDPLDYNCKKQVSEFLNFWLSNCERYRAIALAREGEYYGAVSSIIKAISFNPHYPYKDYESLKADYSKRYAIELFPTFNDMQELFPEIDVTAEENNAIADGLRQQIEFQEVSYNYIILKNIMYETRKDNALISFVEREIKKLENTSPFVLITKSEVIRYLRKGWRWRKINEMYLSRLDETIDYLKQAAELDPDFPVLYSKIGSLLILKAVQLPFGKAKALKEAVEMYQRGGHFLTQLGFRNRSKSK